MEAPHILRPGTALWRGVGRGLGIPFRGWGSMMKASRALPGRPLIRIDVDPAEMEKLDTGGPLVGDAAAATMALVEALDAAGHTPSGDAAAIAEAKARAEVEIRSIQPQMDYLDVIRKVLPRDGFLVEELTQAGFPSKYGFAVSNPCP